MKAAQRTQLRKRLEAYERELSGRAPGRIEPNRGSPEAGRDEDEQPLNEMLQSIASSQNRNREAVLLLVQAALEKLKATPDDYGLCDECGEDIPLGRLQAMPYARFCAGCQADRDGPRRQPTRRKLTELD